MPKFFAEIGAFEGDRVTVTGEDAVHISKVLRMKPGERLTVCDLAGRDYQCAIESAAPDAVVLNILSSTRCLSEPTVTVTLFQGLPKGDKMDLIVQKSVELGVCRIVPVLTRRVVSRPDAKTLAKKIERLNRIAAEAAKQSGRGILPPVLPAVDLKAAVAQMAQAQKAVMLYERDGGSLRAHFEGCAAASVAVLVGPEGGFDDDEAAFARAHGVPTAGLGPRILRTETAPLCALSAIMYATGNL